LQLLSKRGHLGGKRGVGALGRHLLGFHFDVPIAIDMCICDGGGALGRPGPVRHVYRHRAPIRLDGQITRVFLDCLVYLRLRRLIAVIWWIGTTGLGDDLGLPPVSSFEPSELP
jgi:hypothetical protein